MTEKLFWMMAYKSDGDFPRYDYAVSLVDLETKEVKFSSDKRLWINSIKADWEFLDIYMNGEVLCNGYLQECPEGTPLSFDLNEVETIKVLPQ
jgi:hypothetical protein